MTKPISAIIFLVFQFVAAGQDIEVYHKNENDSIKIYAKNLSGVEQSVMLEVTFKGMTASEQMPITRVVPPGSSAFFVTLIPGKSGYSYNYKYTYIRGDVTGNHDDDHIYQLPFKSGESYIVGQSYFETPTHMDKYALDFNMDEGTEICAIREGIVIDVEEKNNKGCGKKECMKYNNYVMIKHEDGSIADYSHIQKKGALVKVGDHVKTGQPIALSGATGWASGPHLHLEVYQPRFTGNESLNVRYYLNAETIGVPKSKEKYQQEL